MGAVISAMEYCCLYRVHSHAMLSNIENTCRIAEDFMLREVEPCCTTCCALPCIQKIKQV